MSRVPAQLIAEHAAPRVAVDHDELGARDLGEVLECLDAERGGQNAVVRTAGLKPGLRRRPGERTNVVA
ncbi:MAG TPA: hypothetical protein VHX66_01935 [Solirubrobacteraceae bacterium]|jgi:hypothetical protein|nr:hypothetical protein [Solirubrobacteraceae bacterium]